MVITNTNDISFHDNDQRAEFSTMLYFISKPMVITTTNDISLHDNDQLLEFSTML